MPPFRPNFRLSAAGSLLMAGLAALLLNTTVARAQAVPALRSQPQPASGVYQPLDQRSPVGMTADWSVRTGRVQPGFLQPIRVLLPGEGGLVRFYAGNFPQPIDVPAPANAAIGAGRTYRIRISRMPAWPGIELYPTIEMIDHLNAPHGLSGRFPVPIELTEEEIDAAIDGQLVTKVIYLENPQLATPYELPSPLPVLTLHNDQNLLQEADRVGRPLAIIRLGGRLPDVHGADPRFFGGGGPVVFPEKSNAPPPAVEGQAAESPRAGKPGVYRLGGSKPQQRDTAALRRTDRR